MHMDDALRPSSAQLLPALAGSWLRLEPNHVVAAEAPAGAIGRAGQDATCSPRRRQAGGLNDSSHVRVAEKSTIPPSTARETLVWG